MASDSLSVFSWVTLVCFVVVIVLCIRPISLPLRVPVGKKTWHVALDLATAPVLGVLFLLATNSIGGQVVADGFLGSPDSIQPFSVVILVFALAYICISIDVTGFFEFVAFQVALRGGTNGKRLFLYLFLLSTVMTIFTSNDVVVLTVTPIVCYLTEETKTKRTAYLLSTFIACNIASMALYIGNPTNIVVAQAYEINFIQYSAWMLLPTAVSLIIAYIMCWFVLLPDIPTELPSPPPNAAQRYRIRRKWGAAIGCTVLLVCLIALMVVPIFAHVPVWELTLPFAVVMIVKDVILDVWVDRQSKGQTIEGAALEMAQRGPNGSSGQGLIAYIPGDQSREDVQIFEVPPSNFHTTNHTSHTEHAPAESIQDRRGAPILEEFPPDECRRSVASKPSSLSSEDSDSPSSRILPTVMMITRRLPWKLVPFSFGMFMLCEALSANGWVALLAKVMARTSVGGHMLPIVFFTGVITTLACNIMNNLPMAILFARVFEHPEFEATAQSVIGGGDVAATATTVDALRRGGMFALIVGSNLGANLTFIGSLAGLMWADLLRKRDVVISQTNFLKKCVLITPVVLVGTLAVLIAEFVVQRYYV
ncbi:hypothetical protein HDU87_005333 [Geranomyces variabilis]|uniref:Citrate transporter-like domain-containing protein n=1 Tax=Geranomyces variabilis TaxID=109894 RepID=A0AAD5THE6_9FUNG|nr:hypothetical protein HDU87_005333 [Geranomyces variabilis]